MGLSICAVSKGYHWSKRLDDAVGKRYADVDIGYIGWKFFRDALLKFASNGVYSDITKDVLRGKEFTWCWWNSDTYAVLMTREEFSGEPDEDYLDKLEYLKKEFPRVYAIYPLISHNDCEGELPLYQCKAVLPVIQEFFEQDK